MSKIKTFTLVCLDCGKTAPHLVSYQTETDKKNGLPYIQCHQRCEACAAEHPTPQELEV